MKYWEQQVASILGVPVTSIEKRYYGNDSNPLQVDEETLLTFYDYLRDKLHFPFYASYQGHTSIFMKLESELTLDVDRGIRVECRSNSETSYIPLTELIVDEMDANASPILLYQIWIQKYQQ